LWVMMRSFFTMIDTAEDIGKQIAMYYPARALTRILIFHPLVNCQLAT
jgi:hypothetical protein